MDAKGGVWAKRVLFHFVGGRGSGAAAMTVIVLTVEGGGVRSKFAGGGVFGGVRLRGVWGGRPSLPPGSRFGRQRPPPMRWSKNKGDGCGAAEGRNCTARRLRGGGAGSCSGEETSGLRSAPQGHLVPSDMRALQTLLPCISEPQSRQVQKQCFGSRPHTPPPGLTWGHIFTRAVALPQNWLPAERPSKLTPGGGGEERPGAGFMMGMDLIVHCLRTPMPGALKVPSPRGLSRAQHKFKPNFSPKKLKVFET